MKLSKVRVAARRADFFDSALFGIPFFALMISFIFAVVGILISSLIALKLAAYAVIFTGLIVVPLKIVKDKTSEYFRRLMDEQLHTYQM